MVLMNCVVTVKDNVQSSKQFPYRRLATGHPKEKINVIYCGINEYFLNEDANCGFQYHFYFGSIFFRYPQPLPTNLYITGIWVWYAL